MRDLSILYIGLVIKSSKVLNVFMKYSWFLLRFSICLIHLILLFQYQLLDLIQFLYFITLLVFIRIWWLSLFGFIHLEYLWLIALNYILCCFIKTGVSGLIVFLDVFIVLLRHSLHHGIRVYLARDLASVKLGCVRWYLLFVCLMHCLCLSLAGAIPISIRTNNEILLASLWLFTLFHVHIVGKRVLDDILLKVFQCLRQLLCFLLNRLFTHRFRHNSHIRNNALYLWLQLIWKGIRRHTHLLLDNAWSLLNVRSSIY